jgi:hypothetical protein
METLTWFDEVGYLIQDIPQEAVEDCAHAGDCHEDCRSWVKRLNFAVPRLQAITYLREFGAWDLDELRALSDNELAIKVLWIACCEIEEDEEGFWLGLVH